MTNAGAPDAGKVEPERASVVDFDAAEVELKALAEATAEGKGGAVALAGAALFVKVLTGSSVAAGAAEKLAGRFGQWLADNPDQRLQEAARECARLDATNDAGFGKTALAAAALRVRACTARPTASSRCLQVSIRACARPVAPWRCARALFLPHR